MVNRLQKGKSANVYLLQSTEKNICDILHRFTESSGFGGSADALSTKFDFSKRTFRNNIVTFQRISVLQHICDALCRFTEACYGGSADSPSIIFEYF